jgi:hypothetical protein
MYAGFVNFGNILQILAQITNPSKTPTPPDAAPKYIVYGQSGQITSGTCTLLQTGNVQGVTNTNPAVITSAGSNIATGTVVTIASVGGSVGVNGTFIATNVDVNNFSVPVAAGGVYSGGGTWQATGLYSISIDTSSGSFAAGQTYTVLVTFAISGTIYSQEYTFTVC